MSPTLAGDLSLLAGLASAVMTGVFLAFSDFLMRGFREAGNVSGMQSMQALNRTVLRSVFLTVFLLLVPGLIALAWWAMAGMSGAGRDLVLAGAAIYLLGAFGVTLFGNVPMNRKLDRLDAPEADYWSLYLERWTRLNHVRTLACFLTAICLVLAARWGVM